MARDSATMVGHMAMVGRLAMGWNVSLVWHMSLDEISLHQLAQLVMLTVLSPVQIFGRHMLLLGKIASHQFCSTVSSKQLEVKTSKTLFNAI